MTWPVRPRCEPLDVSEVLTIRDLSVSFGTRQVLDGLNVAVNAGESVAVTGSSGSGKSTLLNCVLGLVRPDAGSIVIDGVDMAGASRKDAARARREKIGMVFQSGELLPELSPVENVMVSALLAGQDPGQARHDAEDLLQRLGVPAGVRSVTEFSGGERQRVAVARALINRPRLVLADEPTGSLDPSTRDTVIEIIYGLPARFDCALVVVTHDPVVADRADRRLMLDAPASSTVTP